MNSSLQKLFIPAASVAASSDSLEADVKAAESARKTAFFNFLSSLDATGAPSKPVSSNKGGKKRRRDSAHDNVGAGELGSQSHKPSAGVASGAALASKPNRAPSHAHGGFSGQNTHHNHAEYAYYGGFGANPAYETYGAGELHSSRNHSGVSTGYHNQHAKTDFAHSFYYQEQYAPQYNTGFYHPGHPHGGHFRAAQSSRGAAQAHSRNTASQSLGSMHLTPDVARALALQLLPILRDSQHGYGTAPAPADAPVMGGFAGAGRSARPHQAPAPPTGPPEFAHIAGPSDMHLAAELASAVSSRHPGSSRGGYAAASHRHYDSGRAGPFTQTSSHMHNAPSRSRADSASLDLDLLMQQGGPNALAALASHVQQPHRQQTARDAMSSGALHGDGGRYSPPQSLPPRFAPRAAPAGADSPPRAKHSPVQDRDAAETLRNMAEGTGSESSSRQAASSGDLDTAAL